MTRHGLIPLLTLMAGAPCALAQTDASRAYAADLLADADGRTSTLSAAPSTVEWGGVVQFRYVYNSRDGVAGGDDTAVGFQNSRTTLWATGTVGEDWIYRVQGNFEREGGAFILEDAFFANKIDENWLVGAGQLYFPVLWEDYVDRWHQLAADVSVLDATFRPGRVQGAFFHYSGDSFRAWGAVHDGAGSVNSDFTSMSESDVAVTGRAEYMWAGEWARFNDFTSFRGSDFAGKVGACLHWETGGETFATPDRDLVLGTIDAALEGDGWNAFGAFVWVAVDPAMGMSTDDYGFLAQAGVFLSDSTEFFGRYDVVLPDDDRAGDPNSFSTVTVGLNHYFLPESHAAKLTLDTQFFLDEQATSIVPPNSQIGLLSDGSGDQFVVRLQMQIVF